MLGNWWDSEAVLAQLSTKDWEKVTVNIKEWGATSAGGGVTAPIHSLGRTFELGGKSGETEGGWGYVCLANEMY